MGDRFPFMKTVNPSSTLLPKVKLLHDKAYSTMVNLRSNRSYNLNVDATDEEHPDDECGFFQEDE